MAAGNRVEFPDTHAAHDLVSFEDLAQFIGANAESYVAHLRIDAPGTAVRDAKASQNRIPRWHWPGFLVTVPWLFYRKMYAGGLILVSAPVILNLVVPGGLFLGWAFVIAVITGLFARRWYLEYAKRRIVEAREKFESEHDRVAFLRRAGGVSIPGAVLGAAIEIATVTATLAELLTRNAH